jgi:hypothetical protein
VILTLYTRLYCPLCEAMLGELRDLQRVVPFALQVVDIEEEEGLEERFGTLVPVLAAGEQEICRYRLDPAVLSAFLAEIR